MTYVGSRENLQILATNAGGTNARASEISREFYGADLRWDNKGAISSMPYNISFGLNYGKSDDARRDINIQGAGLGPNRIEDNIVDIIVFHAKALSKLLTRRLKLSALDDTAKIKKNGANRHGNNSVHKKSRRLRKHACGSM